MVLFFILTRPMLLTFSVKEKLTSQTWDDGTKVAKIMIPLN